MDRHASTIKRHRQSLVRNERNKASRSDLKTKIKAVEAADNKEIADVALKVAVKTLDQQSGPRVIHRNKAARIKSRLTRMVAARFAS
ncbi:30S ribosomal protein S20 [Candidatus Neomarinimicrobiota bacterium]